MKKKKVLVLFGGCSSEYNISLQSAYSVVTNLNPKNYEIILIGITQDGNWMRYYGPYEQIADDTWLNNGPCVPAIISPSRDIHGIIEFHGNTIKNTKIDVVFPVLHGKNGEDGTVQGLLELAYIPFVGCNTLSSALCMDKDMAHKIVESAGVKTPSSVAIQYEISEEEIIDKTKFLNYPLFVKPAKAGSSLGITKILGEDELLNAIAAAFQYDNKVVIEEAIEGSEVGCAILGTNNLTVGEVDEIKLSQTKGFFDYTEKYAGKTYKIHMPAPIDKDISMAIKQTAVAIYRALGCSGLARVDMFLTPNKEIIFNEVNTIPGFTIRSRYPNMLKGIGMTFEQILDSLIELAINV